MARKTGGAWYWIYRTDLIVSFIIEKEIDMTEKNIVVNWGQPMTPPSSGSSSEPVFGAVGYNPSALADLLSSLDPSEPPFTRHKMARSMVEMSKEVKKNIEKEYINRAQKLTSEVDEDLGALRAAANEKNTLPSLVKLTNERARIDLLIQEKSKLLDKKQAEANSFFGSDPLIKTDSDLNQAFMKRVTLDMRNPGFEAWGASYTAAYSVKSIANIISILKDKSNLLAQQQAQEFVRDVDSAQLVLVNAKELAWLKYYPYAPPDVSLDNNMVEAKNQSKLPFVFPFYSWFYLKVRNKGDWDFKQGQPQYESFGNFHYGAVGTAAGIPAQVLLRLAGAAQSVAGTTSDNFNKWWSESPYGDDPVDQVWIKAGIEYAKSKGY